MGIMKERMIEYLEKYKDNEDNLTELLINTASQADYSIRYQWQYGKFIDAIREAHKEVFGNNPSKLGFNVNKC